MAPRSRTPAPTAPRRARPPGGAGGGGEPRPSAVNRYLLDSERLVFAVRRHPTVLAGATSLYLLLLAVAALLLGFADGSQPVATAGLVVLLAGTAWFGWRVGDWWVERFTVTDRRVLLVSGLLTRRVAIMPLRKVTDLTYERTLVGRIFGYGAFVMESAGQHQALSRVDNLPRPESLYLQMSDLLFGSGGAADDDPDEDGVDRARGPGPAARSRPRPPEARVAAHPPRATGRPPLVPAPPGAAATRHLPASDAAEPAPRPVPDPALHPRVSSPGSPPPAGVTTPLPQIGRDRPLARRPRGR